MIEDFAFRLIKKSPLKTFAVQWVRGKEWDSIPTEQCKIARTEIEKQYSRPIGHAWWENDHNGEYQLDLSVIVPFYNTQMYARRCIDSILNQITDFNYEIILINDGSPDDCGEIIDSYGGYENVCVIHKPNGGLSDARNCGLLRAKGMYVLFVDSDDFLYPGAIQSLMKTAKAYNADIVEGGFSTVGNQKKRKDFTHSFQISDSGKGMFGYAWGKVYKLSLFEKYCFPQGYWFEDTIIGGLIFPEAVCSVTIPDMVYNYYINLNGITNQAKSTLKSIDTYYIFEELYETLDHYGIKAEPSFNRAVVWQLSKYVLNRCRNIGEKNLQNVFILSAELVQRYVFTDMKITSMEYSFWEKEVCEAFIHKQFKRWKIASLMM